MRTRLVYTVISLAFTAAIFSWLFSRVSPAEVLGLISGADPRGLLMFLAFSLAASLFRTWRYALVLGASGHAPGWLALFPAVLVHNTFADLLPARLGTLVYVYIATARLGVPFAAAASSFALPFFFDLAALAPLLVVAALAAGAGTAPPAVLAGGGLILAGLTLLGLRLLPRAARWAARAVAALPLASPERRLRWSGALESIGAEVRRAAQGGIAPRLFVLSVLVRVCKYASLYVFLFGLVAPLGYGLADLPVARVFLGLVSAEMAAGLPVSGIAGFGAYEGAWALVFRVLVFPERLAQATSIAHHLFTQVYGYTLGALALLVLLLPAFGRRGAPLAAAPPDRAARFYGKAAALIGAAAAAAAAVYFLVPARPPGADATGLQGSAPVPAGPPLADAWVVCSHLGGIYRFRVGEGTPEKLAERGDYPRWSPDGRRIVFLRGRRVVVMNADGSGRRRVAEAATPRAVAFSPDGTEVLFTDGMTVRATSLATGATRTVAAGHDFRELDLAAGGRLAVTVKDRGFTIRAIEPAAGTDRKLADGCSASLSPDGRTVTGNSGDHRAIILRDWATAAVSGEMKAPGGLRCDNQFWSNHPDWIASQSEGASRDVLLHQVSTGRSWRVTDAGDCDRPDLFVASPP